MRHSAHRRTRPAKGYTVLAVAGLTSALLLLEGSPVAWASAAPVAGASASAQESPALAGDMALPVAASLVQPVRANQSAAAAAAKVLAAKPRPKAKPAPVKRVVKRPAPPYRFGTKKFNLWYAETYMFVKYHWKFPQFLCLARMWGRESAWNQYAYNPNGGATGIPQAQPGYKMARFGKDWRTNPTVQIRWGLAYVRGTYGTPCQAWSFWQRHHWY